MSASNPPFTDEHEQLRESIRGFIERELAPLRTAVGGRPLFPDELFGKLGRAGPARSQVPGAVRRTGCGLPARGGAVRGDGAHRLRRHRSGTRRAHQHRHAADLEVRHEEQKQRYLVPAIRGGKIGALGITEPAPGSDVAAITTRGRCGRRLGAGWREDYHHQRRPRRLHRHRLKRHRRAGTTHLFLIVDRGRGPSARRSSRTPAGTPRPPPRSAFQDLFRPSRTCSASINGAFKRSWPTSMGAPAMALGPSARCRSRGAPPPTSRAERQHSAPLSGHQADPPQAPPTSPPPSNTCRCVTHDACAACRRQVSARR